MIKVKVFMESNIAHTQQVYSGFAMLRDAGVIDLKLERGNTLATSSSLVRTEIACKQVYFDLSDSSEFQHKEISRACDLYFKRMLLKKHESEKNLPYGLNYPVLYQTDSFIRRGYATAGWKGFVRSFARKNDIVSTLLNINISARNSSVQHFERLPNLDLNDMGVIFFSRLWNPENVNDPLKRLQRELINEMRIKTVGLLKKELGNRFIGGIQLDDYSKKVGGDSLVKNNSEVHKKVYLANLRKSHIGIATEGLEGSIGFKFAEYLAMSMPIVSNPIDIFSLPGSFQEGENYRVYNTAEECVSKCVELIENKSMYLDMSINNLHYYNDFLRPDKLMLNCLTKVISK